MESNSISSISQRPSDDIAYQNMEPLFPEEYCAKCHADGSVPYAYWFHNKQNVEKARQEILKLFSDETDDSHEWTEQDIYEQSRKIISRWDKA